jgi:hypothetical protein
MSDADATHQLTAGAMHAKRSSPPREHLYITRPHRNASSGSSAEPAEAAAEQQQRRPLCSAEHLFTQDGLLPGEWVNHRDADWQSYYVPHRDCPDFADFDCSVGTGELHHRNKELQPVEFRKIFRPHK